MSNVYDQLMSIVVSNSMTPEQFRDMIMTTMVAIAEKAIKESKEDHNSYVATIELADGVYDLQIVKRSGSAH